ncbi:hypothetical protein [Fodinibius sp.]|nr:hypothetical protein [Fodinibius sp.]MDZ7658061.1 hypothetical protein [Fodinibius sp.]
MMIKERLEIFFVMMGYAVIGLLSPDIFHKMLSEWYKETKKELENE